MFKDWSLVKSVFKPDKQTDEFIHSSLSSQQKKKKGWYVNAKTIQNMAILSLIDFVYGQIRNFSIYKPV
jgi:hypothetical protein